MKKTKEDIEKLKHNWLCDPCWDIETTEGFGHHKKELKAFRLKMEAESNLKYDKELEVYCNKNGYIYPSQKNIAENHRYLEIRVNELSNVIIDLEDRFNEKLVDLERYVDRSIRNIDNINY